MAELDELITLITGKLPAPEREKLIEKIRSEQDTRKQYAQLKTSWALMQSSREVPDARIENSLKRVKARMKKRDIVSLFRPFRYQHAAAVVLLLALSAVMFYWGKYNSPFGNGFVVSTIEAPKGQISKVTLPDGSVVWLNSGTILSYDNRFSFTNRHLELSGQAYLEVKTDASLPLVVSAGQIDVKVLGTKFDVCAYPEESEVQVVLESGMVELRQHDSDETMARMAPGQMAVYDNQAHRIRIGEIEVERYTSWREGDLVFSDTPMAEVVRVMERRFDVVFDIQDEHIYRSVITGNFKNAGLKEIMESIQFTCQISYRIENDPATNTQTVILKIR